MKGKILILQHDLFGNTDANSKLVFRICYQLRDMGYEVTVLGVACRRKEFVRMYNGIRFIHEPVVRAAEIYQLTERLGRWKWLRYLFSWRAISYRLNSEHLEPFILEMRRWLKHHASEFDALIACCSPYYPLLLASEVADKIPVIYYKIDPVGSWYDKSSKEACLSTIENEMKWDNAATKIIMPDVVYRTFMDAPTMVNGHKAVVAQFPNVRQIVPLQTPCKVVEQFDKTKINLLFVGKFYAKIRHPQYLFDLMEQLRDTNIVLHIVGPLYYMGFDQVYKEKYFTNTIPNIRFYDSVPPEEADDILLYADALVHVGNSIDTAMPSKILDYISSGKPILNLCKIRTCPTLPLMERYPLGMTLFEDEPLSEEKVQSVKEFCKANKGKQAPYAEIEKLYPECTIEYVGKQFDDTIQEAISEFKKK